MTADERLLADVLPGDPSCCWVWHGSTSVRGYPTFMVAPGKRILACRRVFILTRGLQDEKNDVAHLCHVRQCMNYHHMIEISHKTALHKERLRDRMKQVCAFGHPNVQANAHIERTKQKNIVFSCIMCREKQDKIDDLVIAAVHEADEKHLKLSETDLKDLRVMAKEEVTAEQMRKTQELLQTSIHLALLSPELRKRYTCRRCGKPGHNVRKCLENHQISGHTEAS